MVAKESKKLQLNKKDGIKIAKGAGIAIAGGLLAYAVEIIPMIDWGQYKPWAVVVMSILVNVGLKLNAGK